MDLSAVLVIVLIGFALVFIGLALARRRWIVLALLPLALIALAKALVSPTAAPQVPGLARAPQVDTTGPSGITCTIPDSPYVDQDLLRDILAPIQLVNGELRIGGFATLVEDAPTASATLNPNAVATRTAEADDELNVSVRAAMTDRLARHLEQMAHNPPPTDRILRHLHARLAPLTYAQRQRVAAQVIAEQQAIGRNQTVVTDDQTTGRPLRFFARAIKVRPDRIEHIIAAALRDETRQSRSRLGLLILGTLGVVICAAAILKAATRRHFPQPPHQSDPN